MSIRTLISFILLVSLLTFTSCNRFNRENETQSESPEIKFVRKMVAKNNFCVGKSNYDRIRKHSMALQMYVSKICTRVPKSDAKNYLKMTYGKGVKELGSGSFGRVYLFQNNEQKFAVKVPKTFDYEMMFMELNSSECINQLFKDSKMMKYFGSIIDCVWPTHKNPHLIMNYLPMTLEEKIKKNYSAGWNSFSNNKKKLVLIDMSYLAGEIKNLHNHGFAHRDLKSENVMVDSDGDPVLVDFGLTTPKGDYSKTLCGTPFYMDYQLINGSKNPQASDIYSLCIIFIEMIEGKSFEKNVSNMMKKGKYVEATKGRAKYSPKFSHLNVPSGWEWLENMWKPISSKSSKNRWDIQTVFKKLVSELEIYKKLDEPNQIVEKTPVIQKAEQLESGPSQISEDVNKDKKKQYSTILTKSFLNQLTVLDEHTAQQRSNNNINLEEMVIHPQESSSKEHLLQNYAARVNDFQKDKFINIKPGLVDEYGIKYSYQIKAEKEKIERKKRIEELRAQLFSESGRISPKKWK